MSSTDQQAAATQQNQATDEEKQRIIALQEKIKAAAAEADRGNPIGNQDSDYIKRIPENSPNAIAYRNWVNSRESSKQALKSLQSEYETLTTQNPTLKQYAESHPVTYNEMYSKARSIFSGDLNTNKELRNSPDFQRQQIFYQIYEENPNDTIQELNRKYEERVGTYNKSFSNVSTDYEATLAARQAGFNVGSGLSNNLPETFQKDFDKRFAEHNKGIALTEGKSTYSPTGEPGHWEGDLWVPENKPKPNPLLPKPVTPQNPRVQTERNNPNRLYANPDYAQPGSDEYRGIKPQVQVLDALLPTSFAEYSSGALDLGGNNTASIFGIEPEKPKQLSDEEFARLSPGEQAAYLRRIEQWNQYVDYSNRQRKQMIKAEKIVNQAAWEKNKAKLLGYLAEEKEAGVKQVTILYGNKVKTVPIDAAFFNIVSTKDVRGILTAPVIPEGYSVAGVNLTGEGFTEYGNNPVGTLLLRKNEPEKPQEKEKTAEEFWGSFVAKVGQRANEITSNRNENVVSRVFAAGGQTAAELAGGLIAIGGEIQRFKLPDIRKAAGELFNGTTSNQTETNSTMLPPGTITDRNLNVTENPIVPPEVTPPTAPGAAISALSAGVMAAAVTRNPNLLVSGASEAAKQFQAVAARQGLLPTIVQVALYVDPFNGVAKALPVRLERAEIPGVSASAKSLVLGYGEKARPVISYTSENKIILGKPKFEEPITVQAITPKQIKRGTKLAADSNALTQKTFTDVQTIEKIKGVTPETLERARNINRIIELGSKSKDVAKQGFGEQPFELIKPEETKSVLESFKGQQNKLVGKLGPVEGSLSQLPFVLPGYVRKAGDFDFHVQKFETAANRARQTAKEIKPAEGREFKPDINESTKSAHVELVEGGKKQKVGEFLNEEETDEEGMLQAIEGDSIFGRPIPEKSSKVEGVKTYSLQRQFVKKGESVFSLQKNEKGELVLEPFAPRKLKDVADFYAIADTKAVNLLLAGKTEQALELGRELSQYKKNFPELNIEEFFTTPQKAEPTILKEKPSLIQKLGESQEIKTGVAVGGKSPIILSERKESHPVLESRLYGIESRSISTRYVNKIPRGAYGRNSSRSQSVLSKPKSISLVSASSRGVKEKSVGGSLPESVGYSEKSPSSLGYAPKKSVGYSGRSPGSLGYGPSAGSPGSALSPGPAKSAPSLVGKSPPRASLILPKEPLPKEPVKPTESGPFKLISKKNEMRKKNERKNMDFLGNVYENSVTGMINRNEIKLGIKTTARQVKKDTAFVNKAKGRVKFVKQRNYTSLSKKKQSILSRPNKKELKIISKRSGGLF